MFPRKTVNAVKGRWSKKGGVWSFVKWENSGKQKKHFLISLKESKMFGGKFVFQRRRRFPKEKNLEESRKPFANGLLSIFSFVIWGDNHLQVFETRGFDNVLISMNLQFTQMKTNMGIPAGSGRRWLQWKLFGGKPRSCGSPGFNLAIILNLVSYHHLIISAAPHVTMRPTPNFGSFTQPKATVCHFGSQLTYQCNLKQLTKLN